MPKVSIIIPVYNVASYLPACLDSVIAQTYKDYEVIIVDDGATDESPRICDEYCENRSNWMTIHKVNGGLSSARNAALDKGVSGEYILFLDSDDMIDEHYLEYTINAAEKSNSDVVAVGTQRFHDEDTPRQATSVPEFVNCDKNEFILQMFKSGILSFACRHLFRASLFATERFEEGILYEDTALIPYVFHKCEVFTYTFEGLYFWRMRNDSITHRKVKEKDYILFDILSKLVEHIRVNYPDIYPYAIRRFAHDSTRVIFHRIISNDDYRQKRKFIISNYGEYYKLGMKCKVLERRFKVELFVFMHFPLSYKLLVRLLLKNKT